jgi:hypothetical protein
MYASVPLGVSFRLFFFYSKPISMHPRVHVVERVTFLRKTNPSVQSGLCRAAPSVVATWSARKSRWGRIWFKIYGNECTGLSGGVGLFIFRLTRLTTSRPSKD